MDPIAELENAAFSSFDADDNYDADNATGAVPRLRQQAGSKIQVSRSEGLSPFRKVPANNITIKIVNDDVIGRTVQIFNAQRNISEIVDGDLPNYYPVNSGAVSVFSDPTTNFIGYGYIPAAVPAFTCGVYFDRSGDMIYAGNDGSTTISCTTIPYRALMKYLGSMAFRITRMRINYSNTAQIANDFILTKQNFLGKKESNTLSVDPSYSPFQQQSLIVDVNVSIPIDKERGILYHVNAGQTVTINMAIEAYVKPTI